MVSRKEGRFAQHLNNIRVSVIYLVLATLCVINCSVDGAVPLEEFLPYKKVDGACERRLSDIVNVPLGFRFHYFGKEYTSVAMRQSGMLYFEYGPQISVRGGSCWWLTGHHRCSVMALLTKLSIKNGGNMTFAVGQNKTLLERLSRDISLASFEIHGSLTNFFVATWNKVPHYYDPSVKSTFQIILTTDGFNSFLLFYYNNIKLPEDYRVQAAAGFIDDDGKATQLPGTSCDGTIDKLVKSSNMNVSGKWVFQVHKHELEKTDETTSMLVQFMRFYIDKLSNWCIICN